MNKYSLKEFLEKKLEKYSSTLKNTSFDDTNKRYLCTDESTKNIYDFDEYIEENFDKSKLPASPDAICIGDKKLYFIEFKHQRASYIDSKEIKSKFEKGTTILKDMLESFLPKDNQFIFCVVFENQQKSRFFDSRHIESNSIKFGLQELNKEYGNFYDEIITRDINFYKKEFKNLKCS